MVENNDILPNENENTNLPQMPKSYVFEPNFKVNEYLNIIDTQKEKIDKLKPLNDNLWGVIEEKLRFEWTHNTNAIEGSTLTKSETFFFLTEGITAKGKPFKDFVDVNNHNQALDYLADVVKGQRSISESFIKDINALLLQGVKYTKAINQFRQQVNKPTTPGEYKKLPNHVLQLDGTIHNYTEPEQVAPQMEFLFKWINENINKLHPIIVSAIAHYNMVKIHPFDDGNGRGARILMNVVLMNSGYPPAIIEMDKRDEYITSLREADKNNLIDFVAFISNSLIKTQETILEELNRKS